MNRFLVIIEKTVSGYSAYAPDLPGCIATGATKEDAEHNIHEAIAFHIQSLQEENQPIPAASSFAEYVAV